MTEKNPAAVALGTLGGLKTSEAKTRAARLNAKKKRPNRKKQAASKSGDIL